MIFWAFLPSSETVVMGVWPGVTMEYLSPPLKRVFQGWPASGPAACSRLVPPWISHAVRLCIFRNCVRRVSFPWYFLTRFFHFQVNTSLILSSCLFFFSKPSFNFVSRPSAYVKAYGKAYGSFARGSHGLPKVSLGPVMSDPFAPCRRPPLKQP
jgi:hypothetical protein